MVDNMENKSSSRNNVLLRPNTQTNRETRCGIGNVNADLPANTAATAAAASLDTTDLEQQETYLQVSQQTETTHSCHDHTLGDKLICSKHLQDGQVPEALQQLTATKENNSNLDSDLEKVVDTITKQDGTVDIDCNNHGKHTSLATVNNKKSSTTATIQHQQPHDAATVPTYRTSVLPASAKDSVRRHYVSPTRSRLITNSAVNLLSRQNNDADNASAAQREDLPVAVPAEEDVIHVYAVSHDVTQDEVHKRVQMVRARRDSRRLYFVVFLLVAAAVMIASIVAIMKNKSDGQEQETETEMTLLQNMTQLIVSIMGAEAGLLNDASSPYAKALTWLLQSSNGKKSKKMMSTLAQRFYLTSFYYDTTSDNDKWTYCNPPSNTSAHDQTCYDMYYNTTSKAWLSDSHECDWAGILCDYHQQIIGLGLEGMNLVGTIPSSVAKFPFLQMLFLVSSRLEGNISFFSNCHHLTYTAFDHNLLSGDLSTVWQQRKLKILWIESNHLTGSLSFEIGNLVDLKDFSLFDNELTGTVPSEVGLLDSIYEFIISNNLFRGKLPRSMQFWSMIEIIGCSNSFTGSIPTFLGQLNKTLWELDLYGNKFTGTLPDELFHLTELVGLDVSNNALSGTLDARFAQLNKTLMGLGLSDNQFTGTIPTELGLLTDLYATALQGNNFIGSVPTSLCHNKGRDLATLGDISVFANFILSADCAKDDNGQVEIQCDCCTKCCQADGTRCELQG